MTFHTSEQPEQLAKEDRHDVIISGAGPVGLFLACELALAKCSVLVLEREAGPQSSLKRLPFGLRGLNAPSIEALDRRGLLHNLELHKRLKNPHKTVTPEGPRRQVGHFAGIPFLDGNIDASQWPYRLPGSTPTSLISEIEELETVFTRRAEAMGVQIRRGLGVTGFQQTEDTVVVQAGDQVFRGNWLVGCDGSRSVVRKQGGFEFAGTEPEFTGYSAELELANPEMLSPGRNLTDAGMYFRSQPGYLVMVEFDGGKGHTPAPPTLERVQEALRRVSNTDVAITALHAATTWTDRARQATTYRKGRLLLAGDAAHIHAPLGGQGLNLGLGDAMNLGWKLAATIHGKAPHGLLDTYETERQALGQQVLSWSRAQVATMRPEPAARALNAILRDLMDTRDGATYMAGRVWGVNTRYEIGSDHPLVGRSVPNFSFEDGTTMGELMRNGEAILLDFGNSSRLRALASNTSVAVKCVSLNADEHFSLRAALIRPDGYVAWASDIEPQLEELDEAAAQWFTREAA